MDGRMNEYGELVELCWQRKPM